MLQDHVFVAKRFLLEGSQIVIVKLEWIAGEILLQVELLFNLICILEVHFVHDLSGIQKLVLGGILIILHVLLVVFNFLPLVLHILKVLLLLLNEVE